MHITEKAVWASVEAGKNFPYLVTGTDVYSIFQEVEDFVNVPRSGSPQETGVTVGLERWRQNGGSH